MPVNSFENYAMSWKPTKPSAGKPLYLALAEQLEADIAAGILLPGTKLPPYRELADYLDINVSTITRAFKVCKQKGLLSGTIGSGTFVSYDTTADTRVTREPDSPFTVEMGPIFPRTNTTEDVSSMLKKMMTEPNFGKLLQYGDLDGSKWKKKAAAKLIRKAGYDTEADSLLPATGGQNAIAAILAGLFQAGDRIGTDPLTYPGVKTAAKMLGIELIPIEHENHEISEAGLLHSYKNEHIKGLYIMPDYHNPTTHIMSLSTRKMIARIAQEKKLVVIEDGAHSLQNAHPLPAVATFAPEHTIYIASLSKTVAPGFRLAYIASPLQYKSALSDALYTINLSLSPFLTELASRMIAAETVNRIIREHRQLTKNRNRLANQYLPKHLLLGADECIFRWLLLPNHDSGKEFEQLAQKSGVQVYASERFAVGKAKPPAAVRIVVTTPETCDELRTGLEVLKGLLDK